MVVRGWRVVRLPEQEGQGLAALSRTDLAARLAVWVGAVSPHGEIARVWANEAARPDSIMAQSPQGARQTQLSIQVMDPAAPKPARPIEAAAYPWSGRVSTLKPLTPAEIANPPKDLAIVVVQVSRTPGDRRQGFSFDLEGGTGGKLGTEEFFEIYPGRGASSVIEAYAVPAGRWRLFGFGALFDYCLGAPSARIKAGDVVFFGNFSLPPEGITANMSLEPAAAHLAANPDLVGRLQPASWVNGDTYPCRFWHPYALELRGFPYEPGYDWAGAHQAAPYQ